MGKTHKKIKNRYFWEIEKWYVEFLIIDNIIWNRLRAKKPIVILLTGGSIDRKSYTGLNIVDKVNKRYKIETTSHPNQ